MDDQNYNAPMPNGGYPPPSNGDEPGKGAATGSLVCGIISIVLCFSGYSSMVSLIIGVIGLVLASNSKKAGFNGDLRTAGFVLSLLGVTFGAVIFVACLACASTAANWLDY